MGDEKKNPDLFQQLNSLRSELAMANKKIQWMQTRGGFTDAKTHSMRATRIEGRLDTLEIQVAALLDVAAFNVSLLEDHLRDRHDASLKEDAIDVASWRRMRRRLTEMAEKLGLAARKRAVSEGRHPTRAATA
jgi:hypothetical protein